MGQVGVLGAGRDALVQSMEAPPVKELVMKKALILSLLFAPCVCAGTGPLWPTLDTGWNPVMWGTGYYVDALANSGYDNYGTPPQKPLDIVGGTDPAGNGVFAAGFWQTTPNDLMFRMRVDGNPSVGGQFVWTALLNTDADSDVEWAVQLDLSGDNQVELVRALSGSPANGWNIVLASTGIGFDDAVYSRFSTVSAVLNPPYTGSKFHGPGPIGNDYFIDFAVPLGTFTSTTGWNGGDPLGIAFSTSASHTSTNKDRPDYTAWPAPPGPPSPTVPVPGAAALVGLGAALVGWLQRRKTV